MQKAVLISIHPEWIDKIASGEKTLEIRKNYPKLKTPFKCYIYCTLSGTEEVYNFKNQKLNGKIISEFTCDMIVPVSCYYSNPEHRIAYREQPYTAMTDRQMIDYLGNGQQGYGWHITNYVHHYYDLIDISAFYSATTGKQLTRPPQSWCYVNELEE